MPNSAFRPLTPRVGDLGYVATPPPTLTPTVSLTFANEFGVAQLCGFSEYSSPTVPPKKYTRRTFSGTLVFSHYTALGCILGNRDCNAVSDVWTGVMDYAPGVSCDTPGGTGVRTRTGQGACGSVVTNATSIDGGIYAPIFSYPTTQTTKALTGTGCLAYGVESFLVIGTPTAQEVISIEDTEAAALARASVAEDDSPVAYREARGAGDFSFGFSSVTFQVNCEGLTAGQNYHVEVNLLTEVYGGGSPVESQREYDFMAPGTTYSFEDTVAMPASGVQVTVQDDPTIVQT